MYYTDTFEEILARTLGRVPNSLDKRESSFMYNAMSPISVELQNMYLAINNIFNLTFFDTSDRYGKIERCRERGIDVTQFDPTYAKVTLQTSPVTIPVEIGARFNYEEINFVVTEYVEPGIYRMTCETAGEAGNVTGEVTPINYINGLFTAEIISVDEYGEDEAPLEEIDKVFYASLNAEAFGGNRQDYMIKVHKIDGIGGVKIYSANDYIGGGHVKLVIQTSGYTKPTGAFVAQVQNIIDPPLADVKTKGYGTAPIGHDVDVFACEETEINLDFKLTLAEGAIFEDIEAYITQVVDEYLLELNKTWEDVSNIVVRVSQIENRILDIPGVIDIEDTTINGIPKNLTLATDAIAKRGTINARN